ncbi:MAG: hypothetical protein H7337_01555 [Rhizobacter sp.]|nr:hypothetical protein [Rhizobacter sp.]
MGAAQIADTTPANSTYRQICHGSPPPDFSSAVAMIGVMPDAKMPESRPVACAAGAPRR